MAARKEVWAFIQAIANTKTPPTTQDIDTHVINILERYNEERASLNTLENDLDALARYLAVLRGKIDEKAVSDFQTVIHCLIQGAHDWGITLSDEALKKYEQLYLYETETLADYVRNLYKLNNATQTITGDEASQTKPTTTPTQKTKRPRGRPKKEFEDYFKISDDAEKIMPILTELLKGKYGKDAARIIAACYEEWMKEPPTAASIERKFGIEAAGLKEPLRCHFTPPAHSKPKFPKFTDKELQPIIEQIKGKLQT